MRYSVSEWNSLSRSPPLPGVVFEKFAMAACVFCVLRRSGVVRSRDAFVLIDAPPRGCPTDAGAKIRCMNPRDSHVARAAARAFLKSWRIVSATLVVTLSRVAEESRSKSSSTA